MKITVKRSNGFHSGEKQPHEPGRIAHEAVEPPKRQSLATAPVIGGSVLIVLGAIGLWIALGSEDQSTNSTATPQPLHQTITFQDQPKHILSTAELCKKYNLPLPTDSNGNPVELWGTSEIEADGTAHSTESEKVRTKLSPQDIEWLIKQGFDPDSFVPDGQEQEQPQFNGITFIGSFMGMTNFSFPSDYVISTKPNSIQFHFNGQTFDASGSYAVMLNTPHKHNPILGFSGPEKVKLVVIEDFGGETWPLPDATIWEKSNGFIDVEAMGKEWIYSGDYTIQN